MEGEGEREGEEGGDHRDLGRGRGRSLGRGCDRGRDGGGGGCCRDGGRLGLGLGGRGPFFAGSALIIIWEPRSKILWNPLHGRQGPKTEWEWEWVEEEPLCRMSADRSQLGQ